MIFCRGGNKYSASMSEQQKIEFAASKTWEIWVLKSAQLGPVYLRDSEKAWINSPAAQIGTFICFLKMRNNIHKSLNRDICLMHQSLTQKKGTIKGKALGLPRMHFLENYQTEVSKKKWVLWKWVQWIGSQHGRQKYWKIPVLTPARKKWR